LLRHMKFEPAGFHPIQGHAVNVVDKSIRPGHCRCISHGLAVTWSFHSMRPARHKALLPLRVG
jgi:hypothetical protein